METVPVLRATQTAVSERMLDAWTAARPVTQGALVVSCAVSIGLGAVEPLANPSGVGLALCGALLALAALVDVHEHKLPNRLLALAVSASTLGVAATGELATVARATLGLLIGGGLMLVVRLSRGVGMGDVKMAAVVGSSTAAVALMAAPVAIALAAAVAAGYGLLADRLRLPLGPALWFGWAVGIAVGAAGWFS